MIYFGGFLLVFIFALLAYRIIRYKLTKYNRENMGLSVIAGIQIVIYHAEYIQSTVVYILLLSAVLIFTALFLYGLMFKSNPANKGPAH